MVGSDHVKSLATVPIVINELDIRAVNLNPFRFWIQQIGPTASIKEIVPQLAINATTSALQSGYAYRTPRWIGPKVFHTKHFWWYRKWLSHLIDWNSKPSICYPYMISVTYYSYYSNSILPDGNTLPKISKECTNVCRRYHIELTLETEDWWHRGYLPWIKIKYMPRSC